MQYLSQAQPSGTTVIQNQRYIHERVSGIFGLLNNNVAKPSEILGIKEMGSKEAGKKRKRLHLSWELTSAKHKNRPAMGARV